MEMKFLYLVVLISIHALLKQGLCSNVTALGCKGSTCFWVVGPPVGPSNAAQLCSSFNGSRLATIEDSETNTFVTTKIDPLVVSPWIGVKFIIFPWKWTDGTPYIGNKLQAGDACKHCALVKLNASTSDVNVTASNCQNERRPFICSEKGTPPTSSSITVHQARETWNDARLRCRDAGQDLAVFPGTTLESMVTHIKTRTSQLEFWIGLYSRSWISTTTGKELNFLKLTGGCSLHYGYRISSYGIWHHGLGSYRSLCSLDPTPTFMSPDPTDELVPSGRGEKPNGNTHLNPMDSVTAQQGFKVVQHVVIPVVCAVGGCIIMSVIACILWRKAKTSRAENEEMNRNGGLNMTEAKRQGAGYDNLASKSGRADRVYEDLDKDSQYYSEIIE